MDMKGMIKQAMQQAVGITDEDFEKYLSFPKNLAIAEGTPELLKYKVIAEVTEAKYCSAGLKPGQKYVFQALPAMLLVEESDAPPCARALAPLGERLSGIWDKILEGADVSEGEMVGCLDPGLENGGLGHVTFRVYAEKAD